MVAVVKVFGALGHAGAGLWRRCLDCQVSMVFLKLPWVLDKMTVYLYSIN
jgi:hypothetical protein